MINFITNPEDLEKLKTNDKFQFVCKNCGKQYTVNQFHKSRLNNYKRMLCLECAKKDTCIKMYGVDAPAKNKEILQKMSNTIERKTGEKWTTQTENFKKKAKKTNMKNLGVEYALQNAEVREKGKLRRKEKYNDENYNNRPKAKETCLRLYNDEIPIRTKSIQQKSSKTCKKNNGVDWPMQSESIKASAIEKCLEKYNKSNYFFSDEYVKRCLNEFGEPNGGLIRNNYMYNGIKFHSSDELYYYIYCITTGKRIERNSDKSYAYEYNNKIHYYFPDFKVNNEFVEIKGGHFFKPDGSMQNPYDHSQDELYEAKHQCGLKNNVKFLITTSEEFVEIKKFVDSMFGKQFIEYFKILPQTELDISFVYLNLVLTRNLLNTYCFSKQEPKQITPFDEFVDGYSVIGSYMENNGFGITPFD